MKKPLVSIDLSGWVPEQPAKCEHKSIALSKPFDETAPGESVDCVCRDCGETSAVRRVIGPDICYDPVDGNVAQRRDLPSLLKL